MREIFNMDYDWKFHKGDVPSPVNNAHNKVYSISKAGGAVGPPSEGYNDSDWQSVDLPHDWAVENELDQNMRGNHGYKQTGIGWYRKRFFLDNDDVDKHILLEFGAIATHSVIYFNGTIINRNESGYNSFALDVTELAYFGSKPNTLTIKVDCTAWEGWWYEGCGIYRHVKLIKKEMLHIAHWGVKALPQKLDDKNWSTNISVKMENSGYAKKQFNVAFHIFDDNDKVVVVGQVKGVCDGLESVSVTCNAILQSPKLWDIDSPNLYKLVISIFEKGMPIDVEIKNIGYRTIRFDPNDGFFLNEKPVKLKGTCNHQDHAGVGVALPDALHEYRIKRLKDMGSNAYRSAHNNPSEEILDACDRLGMLVMDENRNFNTSPEVIGQLESMVLRDCNHPSVIMYSIANEEPLQNISQGGKIAMKMQKVVKEIDNTRPVMAGVSAGIMPPDSMACLCDIAGINYLLDSFDEFHEAYPNQAMVSTESVSGFSVRGEYKSDQNKQVVASYDETAADWGGTVRNTWKAVNERKFLSGTFAWTGFDYRGEPTPFLWPSHSTFFGALDTCGFPKENFYLYKALWEEKVPVLHIMPHWNFLEGESVKVMTYTNCDEAELFLNGKSLGKRAVDPYEQAEWQVVFEQGELFAKGYKNGDEVISDSVKTASKPLKLMLVANKSIAKAAMQDCVIINAYALDENDIVVPYADRYITFEVNGNAKILGVGNGDPNCHEPDKATGRSLFHGCCQAILGIGEKVGEISVVAKTNGLVSGIVNISVGETHAFPQIGNTHEMYLSDWYMTQQLFDEFPDPNIKRADSDMNTWEPVIISDRVQSKFIGQTDKYAIYRASVEAREDADTTLHFYMITGYAHIYANSKLICELDCSHGRECDVTIPKDISGNVELSIVLQSKIDEVVAGITMGVTVKSQSTT